MEGASVWFQFPQIKKNLATDAVVSEVESINTDWTQMNEMTKPE